MAKNKTEKSCYESTYGGGWITPSARLAELVCERISNTQTLTFRFWQNDYWAKIFKREMVFANRLLDKPYAMEAIVKALNTKTGRRITTLAAPFFLPVIEQEQKELDLQAKRLEKANIPNHIDVYQKPRPSKRHGKSIREKLENKTNGEIK